MSQPQGTKEVSGGFSIRGLVTIRNYELLTERAVEIDNILAHSAGMSPERFQELTEEMRSLCTTRELVKQNLVVLSGRTVLARLLAADTTYTGAINYGALGSGSTAVTSADVQLATEVFRKQPATKTRTNATLGIDFYYSKADTNGTYNEFGTFIDGGSGANTGQLFNRVLTGGWVKTNLEAMTVSIQFDINDS